MPRSDSGEHSLSAEQVELARDELRKVFRLAAENIYIEMFSEGIDAVWHQMLEDESSYEAFSMAATDGLIIGHAPTTGAGTVQFIESYERRYGKLPRIWFYNAEGQFDQAGYDQYLQTGNVISRWICTPTHNCAVIVQ